MAFLQVIADLQNPDNRVRGEAESKYEQLLQQNPEQTATGLMEIVTSPEANVGIKQLCLINMKQLVPKYWSMGFPNFIGPPLSQPLKQSIRSQLLQIISSPDTRIRGAAAYCIVQIAAADYPDEWPTLLDDLYTMSVDFNNSYAVIGALTVFGELFDDLITEDQFWEGDVCNQVTKNLATLFQSPQAKADVKMAGVKFYEHAILASLRSPEAFASDQRKQMVASQVTVMLPLILQLIAEVQQANANDVDQWLLRSYLYKVVSAFIGSFNKRIDLVVKQKAMELAVTDLQSNIGIYRSVVVNGESINGTNAGTDPTTALINMMSDIVDTVGLASHSVVIPEGALEGLFEVLRLGCVLPQERVESYEADFNDYVTDMTGLSTSASLRESITEFITDAPGALASGFWQPALGRVFSTEGLDLEASLFMMEQLLVNDDGEYDSTHAAEILQRLSGIFGTNELVNSRLFLVFPRFFEKFEEVLGVQSAAKPIVEMVSVAKQSSSLLVKISALVSFTYYVNFLDVSKLFSATEGREVQQAIFEVADSLVEDSEEDGLPPLLEAITAATKINPSSATNVTELIFKITLKDAANVQLSLDAKDALIELLQSTPQSAYLQVASTALPIIIGTIANTTQEYTPELYISLELLGVLFGDYPATQNFPKQVFEETFPIISKVIMASDDNQILQSGAEVLNKLIERASDYVVGYQDSNGKSGLEIILELSARLLSPQLDDSAAMYTGLVILSLVEKFQSYLNTDYLVKILDATVQRLVIAKHPVTIENLILVFCHLILSAPNDMVTFLKTTKVQVDGSERPSLAAVLPVWFESYEVTRGYDKITKNSMALGKLFSLNDADVTALLVNGDIIPYDGDKIITRSMKKSMPDRYTQISAMLKILKLLVGELQFQMQQPDEKDYNLEQDDNGNDGWEDLEDVGVPNYEKLKSYVGEGDDGDDDNHGNDTSDGSLLQFLKQFFRECTQKNLGNFEHWFPQLSDDEKTTIMEAVAF
ncbi:hypothetical protein DIURU_000222 [Diutina rugosa]|uniref:Importin N-terminal domain-containing protein n=1 Tax=Diutina rugosa TaxID=5481 RepID=A0A642UYU3_DIURU|nr:uncharacterized protein DIURU_000222 [Diutina rugosa]KAA8908253.1 hypothetical protein DIURU_000222 [Diutina rugosa]